MSARLPYDFAAPPLRRRMGSWIYEGLLALAVIALPSLVFSVATQARDGASHRHGLQVIIFIVLGLYFAYFWTRGQTLPMKTWRLRLVDCTTGEAPRWPRALLRYFLAWLWFVPPLAATARIHGTPTTALIWTAAWIVLWAALTLLRRDHQFLHDAWAGTRIIDRQSPSSTHQSARDDDTPTP